MNVVRREHLFASGHSLKIVEGDITEEKVDAIVNAANSFLKHGGGVARAIVDKGGKIIQEESDRIGFVPVGQVAITTAGALPAKKVIHAVGPRWGEGNEEEKLRSAVWNSLEKAQSEGFQSIALPAISAGIFGFPKQECARILLTTARDFVLNHPLGSLREIRITLLDKSVLQAFLQEWNHIFPDSEETKRKSPEKHSAPF
ncbi:MAG: macro domain-containing protein [bacterium JZ-2024 1]